MIYYVSTTGTDGAGINGSINSPWRTLSYAGNRVSTPGDVIHVNAGTHPLTSLVSIKEGVSIEGEGVNSLFNCSVAGFQIYLSSSGEGANGNQHVLGIRMNGNLTATGGIKVGFRSNVSIHDCTIQNFVQVAAGFYGAAEGSDVAPGIYATGNTFYNNIVTNCAGYATGSGYGNLRIEGQQGILIHDNIITATGRPQGQNGCGLKPNWTRGMKIYNNTIQVDQTIGYEANNGQYNFAIELWDGQGTEIYNNNIYGCIDIGGYHEERGTYAYGVSIHNNFIGSLTNSPVYLKGIELEASVVCEYIYIYNNNFKYLNVPINFLPSIGVDYNHIYITYNKFDMVGSAQTVSKWGVVSRGFDSGGWWVSQGGTSTYCRYFYFDNNIFIAGGNGTNSQAGAIYIPSRSDVTVDYWYIRNNIIVGFDEAPINTNGSGSINHLTISNNICYNNANNNDLKNDAGLSFPNSNIVAPLKTAPPFVSTTDYHLTVARPGVNVGLTSDFAGSTVAATPTIGVYEYGVNTSTYQITLTVLPANAVNKTVTWSVQNGTGQATINQTGLVTAQGNGTVTAKATANDGSGVFGTLLLTIVGQKFL